MSQFDNLFAAAASPSIAQMFGETIVYRPLAGSPRTITGAIVNRILDVAAINGVRHGVSPRIEIELPNDPVTGISSTELNTGGDQVDVAAREGGVLTTRPIVKLLGDGATLRLEVR